MPRYNYKTLHSEMKNDQLTTNAAGLFLRFFKTKVCDSFNDKLSRFLIKYCYLKVKLTFTNG